MDYCVAGTQSVDYCVAGTQSVDYCVAGTQSVDYCVAGTQSVFWLKKWQIKYMHGLELETGQNFDLWEMHL